MKKYLLFVGAFFIATDSFGNDIAANVTNPVCDNATLSQYNGTANVEINWEPNVIALRWYSDDVQLSVPNESQSCVYDGAMYIPPQPTKTGYTFKGWEILRYDLSTIDLSVYGIEVYSKGIASDYSNDCRTYTTSAGGAVQADCNESEFSDLQSFEWKVVFPYGTVYGVYMCVARSGNIYNGTWPESAVSDYTATENQLNNAGVGQTGWCKVTGYKPNNSDILYRPSYQTPWVLRVAYGSITGCRAIGGSWCASGLSDYFNFRRAMYSQQQ